MRQACTSRSSACAFSLQAGQDRLAVAAGLRFGASDRREHARQQHAETPAPVLVQAAEVGRLAQFQEDARRRFGCGEPEAARVVREPVERGLRLPQRRKGRALRRLRRAAAAQHDGAELRRHEATVRIERRPERVPVREFHGPGESRAAGLVLRQRMRLRIVGHLQPVLDAAQEGVRVREPADGRGRE
jgi:hypothetical protein